MNNKININDSINDDISQIFPYLFCFLFCFVLQCREIEEIATSLPKNKRYLYVK